MTIDDYLARRQTVARLEKEIGLSERQLLALAVLNERGIMIVGDLRRALGIKPSAMSRIIRKLGRRIVCQINERDRRKADVSLSENGQADFARFAVVLANGNGHNGKRGA